ncbi:MAG: nucleotidyltransferase family protein, partial [Lachnospiraceae bacterium]|nr:nucleotidyltransferase family protein [Lachnospiraceae bacterium]
MARELYEEEKYLLSLLAYALDGGEGTQWYHTSSADMSVVLSLADKHAILPLLYEGLEQYSTLTPEQSKRVTQICRRSVNQFYRLLFLSSYLTRLLQKQGIPCAVLKGPAAAAAYPIPEARKSGDIDLLLADPSDLARARVILEEDGFPWNEEQLANHHVNFHNYEGIEIELHTMLAEYFEDRELNAFLHRLQIECSKHIHEKNIVGVLLPVPDAPFHAIFLVIHMLHHFLRAGFGLKLLADWATLWSAEMSRGEQGALESMLRESGLYGFAQAVTAVCIRFLRLSSVNVAFLHPEEVSDTVVQNLIIEILEAE